MVWIIRDGQVLKIGSKPGHNKIVHASTGPKSSAINTFTRHAQLQLLTVINDGAKEADEAGA